MEELVSCIDLGQLNANICITSIHDSSKGLNMDMNLADTLLELDAEDIADIYHMVSEWEFNFGSLEGSDKEEMFTFVQIEASPQQHRGTNSHSMVSLSTNAVEKKHLSSVNSTMSELHDRLPSYYTALAPSRTAPWIQSSNQILNKLPAYITDVACVDVLTGGPCEEDNHRQTGKKKLNLAEYRNRREKLMKQQEEHKNEMPNKQSDMNNSSEQFEEVIVCEEHSLSTLNCNKEEDLSEVTVNENNVLPAEERPHNEIVVAEDATKNITNAVMVKVMEPSPLATSDNERNNYKNRTQSTRMRRKSSRSPTRSNSSRSSRSRSPSLPRRRHRRSVRSSSRSSTSSSSSSSRSRSRSRSRSSSYRSRRRRVSRSRSRSWRRSRSYGRRRSPSPRCQYSSGHRRNTHESRDTERQRQIEERRVIYVGKISEGTTRADLRQRFEIFGPIVEVSLHFRDKGDNYGFVTFAYKVDAYEAVEHGNDDPNLPRYDLSFGGRRAFCKEKYADLDAVDEGRNSKANDVDFETLLRAVQAQLHRRPCS